MFRVLCVEITEDEGRTCVMVTGRTWLDGNGHLGHRWHGASSGIEGRTRREEPCAVPVCAGLFSKYAVQGKAFRRYLLSDLQRLPTRAKSPVAWGRGQGRLPQWPTCPFFGIC